MHGFLYRLCWEVPIDVHVFSRVFLLFFGQGTAEKFRRRCVGTMNLFVAASLRCCACQTRLPGFWKLRIDNEFLKLLKSIIGAFSCLKFSLLIWLSWPDSEHVINTLFDF